LRVVYGAEHVQEPPQKGAFPFLGSETKHVAVLDEGEFDRVESVPFSVQLLWLEGEAFPIARPQSNYVGRYLYQGAAPIFIATKENHMAPYVASAEEAVALGKPSDETMLLRCLSVYPLSEKLPLQQGVVAPVCVRCFAEMVCQRASQAGVCGSRRVYSGLTAFGVAAADFCLHFV
jgi:hypothetical protein